MKDTLLNIGKAILGLSVAWVFLVGLKSIFTTEKVYKEIGKPVYHSTAYCEAIAGIGDLDRELMSETGDVYGCTKMSARDAYYDTSLYMCNYCFSPMEINERSKYLEKRKSSKK